MASWSQYILPVVMFTALFFCLLIIARIVFRRLLFYRTMKSLAWDLALHYTHPIIFNTPTVNGFYRDKEVIVDAVAGSTRIRVFHKGAVESDFTVAKEEYFQKKGKNQGVMRFDCENPEFRQAYMVSGKDMAKMKKFLDADLQGKIMACGLPFTVGKYDISYVEDCHSTDKKRLKMAIDFLVEVAGRADNI